MRLDTPFVRLPLRVDAARLAAEVAGFTGPDWRPHPQGHTGNDAVPLIALHGDPANDGVKGPMRPTPALARTPYLRQVLAAFGSVLGRTRLMRIVGNGEATLHCDTNYYWMQRTRVHVPVVTYPEVRFLCGSAELNMKPSEVWIFDTWRLHNVLNPNPGVRIHLVADTVGSAEFWELAAAGERPFADPPAAAAVPDRVIPFDPAADPELLTERANFPVVMSPWEVECLFADLVADLAVSEKAPADLAARLQERLLHFHRTWRNQWAAFGPSPAGWPVFQKLLTALDGDLKAFEKKLPLANSVDVVEAIRQSVVRTAVNPDLAEVPPASPAPAVRPKPAPAAAAVSKSPAEPKPAPATANGRGAPANAAPTATAADPFDRPVFIVAAPRSGSTLLFETLARSPDFWTIGGESHEIFEGKANLGPARHGWASNRLTAADADPDAARALRGAFRSGLRDRDGTPLPATAGPVRMLEKTPKNALRIPFLAAVFPDARFVYLYRDPRDNVSSVIDAWTSGKFVTYPTLPGWDGPPWSLLLIPGWKALAGKSVAEIAAAQWRLAHEQIIDDLGRLPKDRWTAVSYADFLADPQRASAEICRFADVRWDQTLKGELPLSRHTLTPPDPDKWQKNAAELATVLPGLTPVADRVRAFAFPAAAAKVPASPVSPAPPPEKPAPPEKRDPASEPLRSVFTTGLVNLFEELRISLLVSTYQAGKLVIVRAHDGKLNTHFRNFEGPMGVAVAGNRLAVGTKNHVWELHDQPDVARKLEPAGKHDACYLARATHTTGDIRVHEIGWAGDELWVVNTRFSCLCTLDRRYSFVPRWRPRFVSALAPEDRCHLNGMCITGTPPRPKYVTCLGATDTAGGWRENKKNGGMLIDVDTHEVVVRGLSMPHSPRLYDGKLWILESGVGGLGYLDPATGKMQTVATLPGFTRGLDFVGPFAFVGLSQVRETAVFSGIPITETLTERTCGVWVVDIRSGKTVGFLRFEEGVQEIFAVQALPGVRYPDVITDEEQWLANSFVLPDEALSEVPKEMRAAK